MRVRPNPALLFTMLLASVAVARDRGGSAGSAIAPRLTLVGSPASASVATSLHACITNDQPFANARLATGDALRLTLSDGVLVGCALEPSSPAVGDDADWACAVDGPAIELTYLGAPRAWAAEEVRCLRIDWVAPSATTTLRFESQPVVSGRMAPAEPATLVVPVGASGDGGGGVGARVQLHSTDTVSAIAGDPPTIVPGLDTTLDVSEGSNVVAWIDAIQLDCHTGSDAHMRILLVVDGVVVARQPFMDWGGWWSSSGSLYMGDAHLSWLTPALPAGPHHFQVGIDFPDHAAGLSSSCVGSRRSDQESRLTLIELKAN